MATPRFDHLYPFDELVTELRNLAEAAPELMSLESAGTSHEGRDIWLATVTNSTTGPHHEKPAVFFECNIHATEVTASTAALHLLHHLVSNYGTDPAVTRALDTRTFYVVPRVNPDGVELALRETDPIYLRSSTRAYPRADQQPGLMERDADGDGRTLWMRIEDPDGGWIVHPEEPRVMMARPFDDVSDGPFYRLLPEGVVHDFDADHVPVARDLQGLDLNRNFPQDWAPEGGQSGAGDYPTSEPEVRTVVDAVTARPNIGVYFAYHTFAAVILRPYGGHADDHFPTADLVTYKTLGRRATEITGYETASVFHEFKYDPKTSITGCGDEWAYDFLGMIGWTTEFWSPLRAAGIEHKYIEWYSDHPVADDLALLAWNDDVLGGAGFVDWYPFDHPQFGPVELGGWDTFRTWTNPPPSLMEAEISPHSTWAVAHALALPELAVHDLRCTHLGEDAYLVRAVVKNAGWLPTNITKKAIERKAVRPVEVTLECGDGVSVAGGRPTVELTQLPGRSRVRTMMAVHDGVMDPITERTFTEWIVHGPAGATVMVTARHQRAGVARAEVTLG
ncbi:MAG: carboxypeptidase [Acidimicrobiia bacterium]|nr:carboxypeptidase [Acidimicrobiia bacterium]